MGLIKLWKTTRANRVDRQNYRIKPSIRFHVDDVDYIFCLLPTITYQPWRYRWNGVSILEISWLNIHIKLGEWRYR